MQSDQINELVKALSKAQKKFSHAEKNATNPHFRSNYANLSAVIDACRDSLCDEGLSYSQVPKLNGEQWVCETMLFHSSGQWISNQVPILASRADAQGFGSGLTYARRYGLAALVGVAQEDDDGNEAVTAKPPEEKKPENRASKPDSKQNTLSRIVAKVTERAIKPEDMKEIISGLYEKKSIKDCSTEELSELLALLEKNDLSSLGHIVMERQAERQLAKRDAEMKKEQVPT